MSEFNKLFKHILLENNLSAPSTFPDSFDYADYGLEFIFDIMPTFGPEYQWHTVDDLKAIPELITALQNSPQDVIIGIADGFNNAADAEENEYIDEEMQQPENFRAIAQWLNTLPINGSVSVQGQVETLPTEIQEDEDPQINSFADELSDENQNTAEAGDEFKANDPDCFNTVPDTIQERRPRPYRRGLKALSLANRHKFNQQNREALQSVKTEPPVMTTHVSQQPITRDTIKPLPGVNRPLKLHQSNTFMDNVYRPSITSITKENKRRLYQEENEFTTTPFKGEPTITKAEPLISKNTDKDSKKMLCMICKEYVEPKEVASRGKSHFECPKCGGRLTQGNI